MTDEAFRLKRVNQLILCIATHGRRFFSHNRAVAYLTLDKRGRVWFNDAYTGKRIYTHYAGRWKGFSSGGTCKSFIERVRDYVKKGERISGWAFGPWPKDYCGGDLWGYGGEMAAVR